MTAKTTWLGWVLVAACGGGGSHEDSETGETTGVPESEGSTTEDSTTEDSTTEGSTTDGTDSTTSAGEETSTDESGDDSPMWGNPCREDVTVLDSSAAESAIGFTADDVLAFAIGQHASTFAWEERGPVPLAEASPPSPLAITIAYEAGDVLFVDSQPDPDWNQGEVCEPRLQIEVALGFATDDGRFAESLPVWLAATSVAAAELDTMFLPYGFDGSFSADDVVLHENAELTGFALAGRLDDGDPVATSGTLQLVGLGVVTGEPDEPTHWTLGAWPP
jgi:hypothetical protein